MKVNFLLPESTSIVWSGLYVFAKMPYLVSEERAPGEVSHPDAVAVRVFKKDGKVAVLATNRTSNPVSGDIRFECGTMLKTDLLPYGVSWIEQ